ncbi:MAG: hypothetical protein CVV33_05000 [Methanomicrobiales archaeon HGW-Methanomicrobiales-4]|nr:MAG: hypothetical protein CVV33_05000 [Methanomicrobiales archaeon HGW-Methanomicrobiales-4]
MCQTGVKNEVSMMNITCDCTCCCPVLLPIEDEIRKLEEHKKIKVAQTEAIERKILALKSVKE